MRTHVVRRWRRNLQVLEAEKAAPARGGRHEPGPGRCTNQQLHPVSDRICVELGEYWSQMRVEAAQIEAGTPTRPELAALENLASQIVKVRPLDITIVFNEENCDFYSRSVEEN